MISKPQTGLRALLLSSSIALLSACGGGDSGSSAEGGSTTPAQTGTLTDSAVAGVQYTTSGGFSGTTDALGHFKYNPGETVTFKLGSLTLGTITATGTAATITPIELATAAGVTNQNKVSNLLVLLQSLDSDGDASNGITIPAAVTTALTSTVATALDLTQAPTTFASGSNASLTGLIAVAGGSAELVTVEEAQAHFQEQFFAKLAGTWHIAPSASEDIVFRFDADGNYFMGEAAPDDDGQSGIERGSIDWSPLTGIISAADISIDTNGEWGLSHPYDEVLSLAFDGDVLVVTVKETGFPDEVLRFSRVQSASTGIVGTWGVTDGNSFDTQQFVFLSSGKYFMLDPVGDDDYAEPDDPKCGDAGFEQGSYSLTNGVLSFSNIVQDTNGCAGVHDTTNNEYSVFNSVSINNSEGTVTANGEILLLRPDPNARNYSGMAEVTATTTGTPVSQEGGAYTMFCGPDGEVGEQFPLETAFSFNAGAGTFTVTHVDDGEVVRNTGSYNAQTGHLSWQENEPAHVVLQSTDTTYFSESTSLYEATYNPDVGSIVGGWTSTVTTSWSRDGSRVSCTSEVEFSATHVQ